jgi:hypothetical protein
MPTWGVVAIVWVVSALICLRMGHETGRNGWWFGLLGPLGILLIALLPARKEPSAAVRRLESKGLWGLRIRRETLMPGGGGNVANLTGGWRRQIQDDAKDAERADSE